MALKFSQSEIEGQLADCWPFGSVRNVAIISGLSETILGRGIKPENEYKSVAFEFLQVQCGLDQYDPKMGDCHWTHVSRFRELSRPVRLKTPDRDMEAVKNVIESADVATAHMKGLSLYEQLAEVLEQEQQVKRHKDAILAAINAEKEAAGGEAVRFTRRAS